MTSLEYVAKSDAVLFNLRRTDHCAERSRRSERRSMGIAEVKQTIADVEGYLTEQEGKLLYELAGGGTAPGVIVEIGSWKGKSTICLALGSKAGQGKIIYAIDPHTGS